jgi:diguanylate cyclase (GGDEF)-like protein
MQLQPQELSRNGSWPVDCFHRCEETQSADWRGFMATAIPGIPLFAFPDNTDRHAAERSDPRDAAQRVVEPGMKVLIVDDSAVARKLFEQALFGQPYSLIFASTGQQAVELYIQHRPSFVIMDWIMPDLNGVEICRRIRSLSGTCYTHIVMLTGKTDKASVVEGLSAGADDYLTKPFHEQELIARIAVGFRSVEFHRQLQAKNKTLENLALTDAMTGLPNRRAIDDWAARELSNAVRHGFSFWVIVADLDRFKHVNDTFGHNAGDEVLRKFSKILRAHSRRGDLCGRLGGEEFLMVMTHASREDVQKVVDRIRGDFEMAPFTFNGCSMMATASFGIAGFATKHEEPTFSALVSQADAALYCAKHNGRNRVEIAAS